MQCMILDWPLAMKNKIRAIGVNGMGPED